MVNRYNTVWNRFLAGLIDGLVFLPLSIVDEIIKNRSDVRTVMTIEIIFTVLWTIYLVVGHGKYGQTIGKKVMRLKVLDISEQKLIGYSRAFFREAVSFTISVGLSVYYLSTMGEIKMSEFEESNQFNLLIIPFAWLILEIVSALTNKKRRAVHDYIAGSVVVLIGKQGQHIK